MKKVQDSPGKLAVASITSNDFALNINDFGFNIIFPEQTMIELFCITLQIPRNSANPQKAY